MSTSPSIIYTWTDEAPALATYSFLPIIRSFAGATGVPVETRDISLSARVLALFPDYLTDEQKVTDDLAELGKLVNTPEANIIKLPNISASIPQLQATIGELQKAGYKIPSYPEKPSNDAEAAIKARFDKVKGSAVNPVLRQGNSDRRAPQSVKAFARANPPPMRPWPKDGSKTKVSTMSEGDFCHNEKAVTIAADTTAKIEHVAADGTVTALKASLPLLKDEILDGTFMSKKSLVSFLEAQVQDSKDNGILFSIHMKATMMKVSDPIIFGHAVRAFYKPVFEKHGATFEKLGVNVNQGFGDVVSKIASLPADEKAAIEADIAALYKSGPGIAMVDSDKGITNLHVPSDIIIDASVPPMIRDSGCMWNAAGKLQETNALIPDSSYAPVFDVVVKDCQKNGQYDPVTMGSVSNVGLMASKAEEYGSHDKTFEIQSSGSVRIVDAEGKVLLEHSVEEGDIYRACQVKDIPIRDWVKLAVNRARAAKVPTVFWLNPERQHDAQLISKVELYLKDHDTTGLEVLIKNPVDATQLSVDRIRKGLDTISVTGNVLRDYLTDLFPILEIGTSARMLSIVPLLAGGGLFETGAGGSAPKHVQQFVEQGHLRWDSLGEYMALGASLQHLGEKFNNDAALNLGAALDVATEKYLLDAHSPSRKVGELDNRGSTFYLTLYWAQALAAQTKNTDLAAKFKPIADALAANTQKIVDELNAPQGSAVDIGGYYRVNTDKANTAMRPSATLNRIVDGVSAKL